MKIAFFEIKPEEREFFEKNLKDHELFFYKETANEIVKSPMDFEIISVFINSCVNKELLDSLPNLRYIQTRSTGFDHLDLEEIYKRGIVASNVRGYAGPAVGEFAYGLLLEALRKIYVAIDRVKKGKLEYHDLKGTEIEGKTIGILGLGTIGMQIAKIAKGFGADVVGFNRSEKEEFKEYGKQMGFEEVLKRSDFLFIALPLTPQTQNMINKKNIGLFKGKVIINPARAEIISNEVYESFEGIIAADVLPNWDLAKKENIIATPHMAYYTKEALFRIMEISLENMEDFLNGNTPRHCLKPHIKDSLCKK